jgi:hypothetical protein
VAARIVRRRELVGWHWVLVRRHGKRERIRRGGHIKTIEVIKYGRRCTHSRVKVGRHRWREAAVCPSPHLVLKSQERARFGHSVELHGLLMTAAGLPIARAPIEIRSAPDNGLYRYTELGTTTTNADGTWKVTIAPGPSRLLSAVYAGAPTVQPSEGSAMLTVPASVRVLSVSPRHIAWGGEVHIDARLLGGYLPPGGALVRLRLGQGSAKITYGVQEHVAGNGSFEVTNRFGPGPAAIVRHYWLQECTLPEGDYPFAAACGPRSRVTVGG